MNHPVTEKDMQAMKAALLKREQERWAEQMDRFSTEMATTEENTVNVEWQDGSPRRVQKEGSGG